ncbi:MAG: arylsulfatase [Armatimonadetes bacterium]|nr:arylsulfatase [Armatimonadota bacterium]
MSTRRPNLLIVICDDLAYGDIAAHGSPHTRTPSLDRLHHEGTRLTRYCSGPLCTAARACLMTGRHAYRTRAIDTYLGRSIMDPEERTLAEVLRDAGYATGLFGKWHLGDTWPSRPPDKGFGETLWHTGGGLMQPGNVGRNSYHDPDLLRDGRLVHTQGYCSDIFSDAALDFVRRHAAVPWFCYLAYNAPHTPLEIGDEWVEPYRTGDLPEPWARLYGMVANIDWNVGRLLARLDELGLADDSIVLFTSDHGPCPSAMAGDRDRWNCGLRGRKGDLYEGGVRAPALLRYPRAFPAGQDVDRLANPIDWLPTFAGLCGAEAPTDRVIDGVDLAPLLTGAMDPADWPDRGIGMQWHRGDVPQRYRNAAMLRQRYKWYSPHHTGRDELYDLEADPHEEHDLAAELWEVTAELKAEYDAWFDDVSSTRGATPEENYAMPPIHLDPPDGEPVALTWQDWRLYGEEGGWDERHPGFWPVRVAQGGEYNVVLDLPALRGPATLHVQCGPLALERAVSRGLSTYGFERLRLEPGDQRFEAWLDVEGERLGVRYVHVRSVS